MAEMVKKATRESFGEALCALAETNPDIVVLDWPPVGRLPLRRPLPCFLPAAPLSRCATPWGIPI